MYKNFLFIVALLFTTCAFAQNSVKFVDLGLPSGTLWADRNVGASSPKDEGERYAWGETEPKKKYTNNNYKFYQKKGKLNFVCLKYFDGEYGNIFLRSSKIDNKRILDKEDDAASIIYGGDCRMPTREEIEELVNFCEINKETPYDLATVIGPNGKSIIISDWFWSSSLYSAGTAWCYGGFPDYGRCFGLPIRAVKPTSKTYSYSGGQITIEKLDVSDTLDWGKCTKIYAIVTSELPMKAGTIKLGDREEENILYNWKKFKGIVNGRFVYEINRKYKWKNEKDNVYPIKFMVWNHLRSVEKLISSPSNSIDVPTPGSVPILTFVSSTETAQLSYKLRVKVNSSSAITDSKVYVNGQLSRGVNPVKNDGAQFVIEQTVTLVEGNNTIRIEATNAAGTATLEKTVRYEKAVPMNKATLALSSPTKVSQSAYSLQVKVNSSSTITNTKVLVNGQAERGVTPVKNDGALFVINKPLTLKEGNNTILVEVTNAAGTTSMNTVVNYTKPAPNNVVVVPSNQQKCIALVIGNSNYSKATSLTNPANDAKDVASKLKSLGFTVIEREDLGLRQFNEAVSDFGTKASQYDVALFYYAGHAIENAGVNYLIPVDATLEKRVDLPYQCVNAQYILDNLEESRSKANIIILDACRNNPIERGWSRSLSGGLAQMIAPTGTFFMFSTSPGRTADDGVGRNSPFTQAFLSCLDIPNIQLEIFAKEVIRKVKDNTQNRQIPWSSSSFYGDFYFNKK